MIGDAELHTPSTVEEVLALTDRFGGDFQIFAGGTDILPNRLKSLCRERHLISLERVSELNRLEPEHGRIGAMVRLGTLARDLAPLGRYRAVAEAAGSVGTPQVRNAATVAGNLLLDTRCNFFNQSAFWRQALGDCLKAGGDQCWVVPNGERCYAVYCGDLAPALMVLGANVQLVGSHGRRIMGIPELYPSDGDGIRRSALSPGELILSVELPLSEVRSTYLKLRPRSSVDFPEASMAAALSLDGGRLTYLRVAVSGVASRPLLFDDLTGPLIGSVPTDDIVVGLAERIGDRVRPVNNTFLPPDYRRHALRTLVRKGLRGMLAAAVKSAT